MVGFALPFLVLEILACSFIQWRLLIGLASVALDRSGDAVAIDKDRGGVSL